MKEYPSQSRLKELFDYDPDGLIRKTGRFSGRSAGSQTITKSGVIQILLKIKNKQYRYADILWIFFNGEIPTNKFVKSKSGPFYIPCREDLYLSDSKNSPNAGRMIIDNSTGAKGVYKTEKGMYAVKIKEKTIGTYFTIEAAAAAYDHAAEKAFGKGCTKNNSTCKDFDSLKSSRQLQNKAESINKNKFIGASKRKNVWIARIKIDGAGKYLGSYATQEQAARAYNIAAHEHYGEHAVLNDIPGPLGHGDPF